MKLEPFIGKETIQLPKKGNDRVCLPAPDIKTHTLHASLNPLTKFKIGIADKVLGTILLCRSPTPKISNYDTLTTQLRQFFVLIVVTFSLYDNNSRITVK
jgi:hypothetical protein